MLSINFLQLKVLVVLIFINDVLCGDRCPPIFGEFECPTGYICKDNGCYDPNMIPSTNCTKDIGCSEETACVEGKCYPKSAVKCNRHIIVAENRARKVTTNCGDKGKCVNGQCVHDKCMNVDCEDGHICRDGECANLVGTFCIGHADCGPAMTCQQNKCQLKEIEALCNCQSNEICQHGQCYPNDECAYVHCEQGFYCIHGQCSNAIGLACEDGSCHGGAICVNNVCVADPCLNRCAHDQDCRMGECRIVDGIPCIGECKEPYLCVDGRCRRNDCATKVCQLGESCEGGSCVKVEGRFCTWAPRDCGEHFECKENKCVDLIKQVFNDNNSL